MTVDLIVGLQAKYLQQTHLLELHLEILWYCLSLGKCNLWCTKYLRATESLSGERTTLGPLWKISEEETEGKWKDLAECKFKGFKRIEGCFNLNLRILEGTWTETAFDCKCEILEVVVLFMILISGGTPLQTHVQKNNSDYANVHESEIYHMV